MDSDSNVKSPSVPVTPQKIHFSGTDSDNSQQVSSKDVTVVVNTGNHKSGSSKVRLKNIVDFSWNCMFYTGQLFAVHCSEKYIGYGLKGVGTNKTAGVVRVVNLETNERALLKGSQGMVVDVAFACIPTEVVLGSVDEFGNLSVSDIKESSNNGLVCTLLVQVTNVAEYVPNMIHRIIWCPYIPDDDGEELEGGYNDTTKLLALIHGKDAELWNVPMVTQKYGIGPLESDSVEEGFLSIKDHDAAIIDASFSPDGIALATASLDGYVKFFQVYMHSEGKPQCLHKWQPFNGRPLSCLFFLDNHKSHQPDAQFSKFVITGTDNNSELKLWSCESWTCIQTIRFTTEIGKKDVMLKAGLDLAARVLLLSDINRRVLYVVQIDKDEEDTTAFIRTISEFLLPNPLLSFGIVEAGIKKFQNSALRFDDLIEEESEDVFKTVKAMMVKMFLVHPKSLQECHIVYDPVLPEEDRKIPLNNPLLLNTLTLDDILADPLLNDEHLLNNFTDVAIVPEMDLLGMKEDLPANHMFDHLQSNHKTQQQSVLNLMTPDVFSSSMKKDNSTEIINSQPSDSSIKDNILPAQMIAAMNTLGQIPSSSMSSSSPAEAAGLSEVIDRKGPVLRRYGSCMVPPEATGVPVMFASQQPCIACYAVPMPSTQSRQVYIMNQMNNTFRNLRIDTDNRNNSNSSSASESSSASHSPPDTPLTTTATTTTTQWDKDYIFKDSTANDTYSSEEKSEKDLRVPEMGERPPNDVSRPRHSGIVSHRPRMPGGVGRGKPNPPGMQTVAKGRGPDGSHKSFSASRPSINGNQNSQPTRQLSSHVHQPTSSELLQMSQYPPPVSSSSQPQSRPNDGTVSYTHSAPFMQHYPTIRTTASLFQNFPPGSYVRPVLPHSPNSELLYHASQYPTPPLSQPLLMPSSIGGYAPVQPPNLCYNCGSNSHYPLEWKKTSFCLLLRAGGDGVPVVLENNTALLKPADGIIGFENSKGLMCSFNAFFQLLIGQPAIRIFCVNRVYGQCELLAAQGSVIEEFSRIITNAWLGFESVLSLQSFKEVLNNSTHDFDVEQEEDISTVAMSILNCISEEIHDNKPKGDLVKWLDWLRLRCFMSELPPDVNPNFFLLHCRGEVTTFNRCLHCNHLDRVVQPFFVLHLQVPGEKYVMLRQLFDDFRNVKQNESLCPHCNESGMESHDELTKLPDIFLVNLVRLTSVSAGTLKLERATILMPNEITLFEYEKPCVFKLSGYVDRFGDEEYGHYKAIVKHIDRDVWTEFNDKRKKTIQIQSHQFSDVVFLSFYKKL